VAGADGKFFQAKGDEVGMVPMTADGMPDGGWHLDVVTCGGRKQPRPRAGAAGGAVMTTSDNRYDSSRGGSPGARGQTAFFTVQELQPLSAESFGNASDN
jgi:hypothetical protein